MRYDWVDSTLAGTSGNYRETATTSSNLYDIARQIEKDGALRTADHVFLYNAQTDTGYLVSDLDRNYSFETGVIIKGASAASDMNWSDIV